MVCSTSHTMSISTATFISLDDALSRPNNSYVDMIVVVADVGALDRDIFFPIGIREVTLKDDRCAYFSLIM